MENNDKTFNSLKQQQSNNENREIPAQLTAQYLQDLPGELAAIKTKLETKGYTAIKKDAHRIKGTSGTFRLSDIAQSAAELELSADSQNPDAISTAIDAVVHLVELESRRRNLPTFTDRSEGTSNE